MFLGKGVLKICSKCTSQSVISKQVNWNRTSACMFSCKFAAYFQNTFPKNTSEGLLLQKHSSIVHFSFLIKLQTPAQVFSCEFCEIENTYFVEQLWVAASEHPIYIFFFVLILCQNRYLPLNSDHLLGKQRKMLRYGSLPSKISDLRFGDAFYFLPKETSKTVLFTLLL